ncbi:MAG: YfbU family protein [Rhodoferax sp.]|nr:YfbU family protein [Rhodoferax sp.]
MQLSKTERLLLANQFHIRAQLEPDQAAEFGNIAEALERGYEAEYSFDYILEGLSEKECRFVNDVLDMFEGLRASLAALKDKSGLTAENIRYRGFDGNGETAHMAYSRYLVETLGKWDDAGIKDHNSHSVSIPRYETMLAKFVGHGSSFNLTADQIKDVIRM